VPPPINRDLLGVVPGTPSVLISPRSLHDSRQLLDHGLASPLPLLQEDQEIGHLLPVRSLVELPDDVGADLAGGGQDPKEIPPRRRSERVSEANRIVPEHRGASVKQPGPAGELPDQLLDRLDVESEGRAVALCGDQCS
jgi:hypothetical protein